MRLAVRHWTVALLAAVLVHAGLIVALLSTPPKEGARAAGVGGIEVGLGPAGGAPGRLAAESASLPEAESDSSAESALEPMPETPSEPVDVERAEAVEAPMEPAPLEVPDSPKDAGADAVEAALAAPEAPSEEAGELDPTVPVLELSSTDVPETVAASEPLPAKLAEAAPIEEALAASEPPAQVPKAQAAVAPPAPRDETKAQAPVKPPPPRTKPQRPRSKTVRSKPAPKPAEAEPIPPAAEAAAEEAGATEPSETRTAATAPSAPGADGKAGTEAIPGVGSGDGSSGGGLRAATIAYNEQLRAWLQKHKRYPRRARLRNQQGMTMVHLVIDRDGKVLESDIRQPSGHRLLDSEALKTIERAEPLPKPPAEIHGESLEFLVPMEFFMR